MCSSQPSVSLSYDEIDFSGRFECAKIITYSTPTLSFSMFIYLAICVQTKFSVFIPALVPSFLFCLVSFCAAENEQFPTCPLFYSFIFYLAASVQFRQQSIRQNAVFFFFNST